MRSLNALVIPEYVTLFPRPSPVSLFSHITDVVPLVDKATKGVKIRVLVNCPPVMLVKFAVNSIAAEESPTWFAEVNETILDMKPAGCRVVDHVSVFPKGTIHEHILCSLSLGHSP